MGKRSRGRKSAKGWEEEHESRAELLMCPSATCTLFGAPVLQPEDSGEAAADTVTGSSDTVTGTTLQSVVTLFMEDEVSPTLLALKPVLTAAECAAWIQWGESIGFEAEKHSQTAYIAHRDNGRIAFHSDSVAAAIFERIRPFFPERISGRIPHGCNPNIRLYRYEPGQRFGKHIDQANRLADGGLTEFTVLIYLNDDGLEGGETLFYEDHAPHAPELLRWRPLEGAALVHAHGDRCLTHEGAEVKRGVKYLLRTDLAYACVKPKPHRP